MVSLFFFLPPNQGEEDPFYREKEASLSCKFPMWDCLPQRKKKLKPQNVGPTPLSLVIFQCGIVSHKRKKILSLKIWGLQSRCMILYNMIIEDEFDTHMSIIDLNVEFVLKVDMILNKT